MEIAFWISLIVVFYTFVGYGLLLFLLVLLRRVFFPRKPFARLPAKDLPYCTLVIAAYNEEHYIEMKIENSLAQNYPSEKLRIILVTDGSTDGTVERAKRYPQVDLLHRPERLGKVAAMERAMNYVDSEIVVFTDANTFLNPDAVLEICQGYADPEVGAVAGEKRVSFPDKADASSAGEGFYWKYESQLKKWDSELYSVVGTAGELFSIRRSLHQPVPPDTILDDFMISMGIAAKGYRVLYQPLAYAVEESSVNVKEELKRKVRIAAGGIQSILRLKRLLNPFLYPCLTFQYISHRVLRWTVTPLALLTLFVSNLYLIGPQYPKIYSLLFALQILFYLFALLGWLLENRALRIKIAFIPYYFCMMNYAVLAGILRFLRNKQSAVWVRAGRKQ